jgi:hypothetical protein
MIKGLGIVLLAAGLAMLGAGFAHPPVRSSATTSLQALSVDHNLWLLICGGVVTAAGFYLVNLKS